MGALFVHLLPQLIEPGRLADSVCVVVDVLRATTTISHALANGARDVLPCLEVDDARKVAAAMPSGEWLLGGERGGAKIDGFDLGNSPGEYSRNIVAGKTMVFTTTNGARALLSCEGANRVLLGAFVNLSALCRELAPIIGRRSGVVNIICAGTSGEVSHEDGLLAGAVADRLLPLASETNDPARLAAAAWRGCFSDSSRWRTPADLSKATIHADQQSLASLLREGRGGRNCLRLGLGADIDAASLIDALDIVPVFDASSGRVVLP